MPQQDMSNTRLSKILSVEVFGSICATIFIVGVTWSSIAKDVESAEHKLIRVEQAQTDLEGSVRSIEVDMAVVKTHQQQIRREVEQQSRDIAEVLRLLQKRANENHNHDPDD